MNQIEKGASEKGSSPNIQLPDYFWKVGFTSHIDVVTKVQEHAERMYYLRRCAEAGWSTRLLRHHIANDTYSRQGQMPSNFESTIAETAQLTLDQFRDEYLLDFITMDEADDERLIEKKIVHHIKDFILQLGKGFTFIGNQYRLNVQGKEYFIDLLFFNRKIRSLVAFELKRGAFKPQYAGQLNFYLSALDDLVRLPEESPSIGIILCKERERVTVDYALRGLTQPMGVATFRTADELPAEVKDILPTEQELRNLMQHEEDMDKEKEL